MTSKQSQTEPSSWRLCREERPANMSTAGTSILFQSSSRQMCNEIVMAIGADGQVLLSGSLTCWNHCVLATHWLPPSLLPHQRRDICAGRPRGSTLTAVCPSSATKGLHTWVAGAAPLLAPSFPPTTFQKAGLLRKSVVHV